MYIIYKDNTSICVILFLYEIKKMRELCKYIHHLNSLNERKHKITDILLKFLRRSLITIPNLSNLKSIRMICNKISLNLPTSSSGQIQNVKNVQTDGQQTDGRTDRQKDRIMNRQTDDKQQVIRNVNLNLWFGLAKRKKRLTDGCHQIYL